MPSVSLIRPSRGAGKKSETWVMVWRESGKLRKKSTGTKLKDAARQIARDFERKLVLSPHGLHDPFAEFANLSWADARKRFRTHCDDKYAAQPDTIKAINYCLTAIERVAKPRLLRDCTTKMLLDFAAKRVARVSPATTNKDLRHLRLFLRWCHKQHYLRILPEFGPAFVREDRRLPVVVAPAAVEKLLAAIDKAKLRHRSADWWLVFATIAHRLGPRRGEILGLRWGAVDFHALTVAIASTISKGRRDRVVPIDLELAAMLARWWMGEGEPSDASPVLPWAGDDARKLYSDWHRVCKLAGVSACWKHFRSTCGSELLNSGTPSVLVRDWLGHSSVTTTERFYLAPSQDALREAMERRSGGSAGGNAPRVSEGSSECS
jgi:integrase